MQSQDLYPMEIINGKWGYVNVEDDIIFEPRYDWASPFEDGVALVRFGKRFTLIDKTESRIGVLNKRGHWVIPPSKIVGGEELKKNGLFVAYNSKGQGLINIKGQVVLDFIYDEINVCHNGMCCVVKNEKVGYITSCGKLLIEPEYDSRSICDEEGFANVCKNGKWGVIDSLNECIIELKYEYASNFRDGIAIVREEGRYGYINIDNHKITDCKFDMAYPFYNGFAVVKMGDKYGVIDKEGHKITECEFEKIDAFENGLAKVRKDGKIALIDQSGQLVTEYLKHNFRNRLKLAAIQEEHKNSEQ